MDSKKIEVLNVKKLKNVNVSRQSIYIPVGLNYELWRSGGFHAYVMAGAEADYNVKNDTDEDVRTIW